MTWGKAHGLGHINTFGTSGWQTGNQLSSLEAYLNILERAPGSVNQFNHPGTAYGTFDGFRDYNPRYDRLMQLMEVFGEPGTEYLSEYFLALDAGWHLAPTAGSFCYDPDFGNARTVILAQTLSESSLLQALRQRRAYATQDADLRLEFQLNGTDMGGFTTKADTMELTARFQDETDGAVGKVEVLTIHGRVLAIREIIESAGELTLTLPGGYPYYLLRVTQADGDVAISAPVWAETFSDMGILKFSTAEAAPTAGTALTLELALFNREPVPMSVQSAALYQGSQEVGRFRKTAEGQYQCDFTWDAPGELRLTAKVQAAVEGENRSYQKELVLHYTGGEAMSASVSDVRTGRPGTVYRLTGYAASGNTNSATTFPDTIYIQDETGGIPVRGTFPKGIQVGTPLDITGVLRTENEAPYLDLISLERTEETMRRPLPAALDCREAMDYDTRGGQLVQIQGTLLSLEKEGNTVSRLTLRDGKGDKAVVFIEPEIRSGSGRTHKLSSKIRENRTVRAIGLVYRMADGTVVQEVGGYSSSQILQALGVQTEENIFSFDPAAKEAELEKQFPLLESIRVVRDYPNTVVVQVTEAVPTYAMQTKSGWLTLSDQFKILACESAQPEELKTLYGGEPVSVTPGDQLTFAAQADPAASDASGSAAASAAVQTDDRLDALNELQAKLEEYGMLDDVTRMEFADTDQMAFLYQDRVSVLLGTRNDLDYKLDRARYVLTNADGKGCAPTDTGRLDFSHVSAGSTRKIYFAQGQPTLPSGYVVPEKTVPEEPDTSAAEDTAADGAEDAAAAQPADDTAAAAEETSLTDPARMTANNEENPM